MMQMMKRCHLWLLLFIVLSLFWSSIAYPMHQDETLFTNIAQGIPLGIWPYKDVSDNKPPGIYLAILGIQTWLGSASYWFRLTVMLTNLGSAWLIYSLASSFLTREKGYWAAVGFLSLLVPYQGQFGLTEPVALLFSLLSAAYLIQFSESVNVKELLLAGLWLGVALCFKQTVIVMGVSGLVLLWWMNNRGVKRLLMMNWWKFVSYVSLWFVPLSLVLVFLFKPVPLSTSFHWIFGSLLTQYPPSGVEAFKASLVTLILPLGAWWLLFTHTIFIHKKNNILLIYSFISFLFGIPLLSYRPYHHYWIQFLPFIVWLGVASPLWKRWSRLIEVQMIVTCLISSLYPVIIQ